MPGVTFYGTKTSVFFLFPTSVIVSFFSGVLVNGHLYVDIKKPRSSTDRWTARKPCWSCVEREENLRDSAMTIFNLLIYRDFLPAFAWSLDAVAYH